MNNKNRSKAKEIWEIRGGELFILGEKVYLKTSEPPSKGYYLAVELDSGEITYVDKNHSVEITKPSFGLMVY